MAKSKGTMAKRDRAINKAAKRASKADKKKAGKPSTEATGTNGATVTDNRKE